MRFDGSPYWYLTFYSNLSGHGVTLQISLTFNLTWQMDKIEISSVGSETERCNHQYFLTSMLDPSSKSFTWCQKVLS